MADQTPKGIREHMIINGSAVQPSQAGRIPVYNPATGEIIAHQGEAGAAGVDEAVKAAHQAVTDSAWTQMLPAQRELLLLKLADLLEANADELAQLETMNSGKLLSLSYGLEVYSGAQWLRYMAGWVTKVGGDVLNVSIPFPPDTGYHAYTRLEPVGVVAAIVPWNFPLLMAIWKMAPALAAGCTVVLKPAEETPLTAIRLAELALEAGFPPGVFNVITGTGEVTGAALTAHPLVNKISFTGSTEVGRIIAQQAAKDMKRVALELGGKSPVLIFDDCDVEQAIQGAANAIFFNQGQVCTAGSRVYIQDGIYEEVVNGIAALADQMVLGAGADETTQIAPLVSARQKERVEKYIQIGQSEGRQLTRNTDCPAQGFFVRPTVFADVDIGARISQEEIFGPVLVANRFTDEKEALTLANQTEYGLGASVWSNDISRVNRLVAGIKAGTVWVNTHNMLDPHMPFGGFKQSGMGREHGKASVEAYLESKSICVAYTNKNQ